MVIILDTDVSEISRLDQSDWDGYFSPKELRSDSIEPRRPGKAFLSATLMTQSRLLFQSNECACTNVQTAESFCGILIPWLAELFSLATLDIYTNRISVILPIV